MEIWRVTQPQYRFEAPPIDSINNISKRFSLKEDGILFCAKDPKTALRECLQVFYKRKHHISKPLPKDWRLSRVLLKGNIVLINGEIIDIESPVIQRELDVYLGDLLDQYGIPHIDTSVLRGNFREITHAVSEWVFHVKKGAGLLYRSKFESDGICYALFSSKVSINLIENNSLSENFEALNEVCTEFGLTVK